MPNDMRQSDAAPLNGVKPAEQARSIELQSGFVRAGRKMLENSRLADIRIPDLAAGAGSSVGGFYSRFENKEGLFEFMRSAMMEEHGNLIDETLDPHRLAEASDRDVITIVVDMMIKIFSSPWRGVLKESYAGISEGTGMWAPMRARGDQITDTVVAHFLGRNEIHNEDLAETDIRFAMQMLYSALNHNLMNADLQYTIGDEAFRTYLIEILSRFLELKDPKPD